MEKIADYEGSFLNHLEGFYRPGDRDLARELIVALGMIAADIRFTENSSPTLAMHPNGNDRDPTNNVIFLYEMGAIQLRMLDAMDRAIANDEEFAAAISDYREAVRKMPPLMPHFGLRFHSSASLEAAVNRLQTQLSPALAARVSIWEVPPYKPIEGLPDIRQVFVRTDVFSIGYMTNEQAFELQVDRARV